MENKMEDIENELKKIIDSVQSRDENIARRAKKRWDSVAHPLGGLGLLEDAIINIAASQSRVLPDISKKAVAVFCADNGIVSEGVTQTGQEVTAIVSENMCTGKTSVCNMARAAGAEVFPVDVGLSRAVKNPKITDLCVRRGGTANFLKEDAMTRTEAIQAVLNGARFSQKLADAGFNLLAAGEMGIGNTTTSTAVACVLLDLDAAKCTGRGAGLSDSALMKKIRVIKDGIALRKPNKNDVIDVLCKVGGLDIAAMTGFFIGSASRKVPVLIDGFISALACLLASRLCSASADFAIATHKSSEPAFDAVLSSLGKKAFISAEMHLGEGTGAVLAMPSLDLALKVYENMATFGEINVEAYKR